LDASDATVEREARIVALDDAERDVLLAALDEPPERLLSSAAR
jgi:uncharacterized protein (DUF1778 family)